MNSLAFLILFNDFQQRREIYYQLCFRSKVILSAASQAFTSALLSDGGKLFGTLMVFWLQYLKWPPGEYCGTVILAVWFAVILMDVIQ